MYIIINIGCLCCETPSEVVGSFETLKEAEDVFTYLQHDRNSMDLKHDYALFNVPDPLSPLIPKYQQRVENGKKINEAKRDQLEKKKAAIKAQEDIKKAFKSPS